jgi:hypothetical protein
MMPFCIDWAFAQILAVTAPLGYLPETFHEAPLTLCDAIVSTTSNPLRAGLDVNSELSLLGGGVWLWVAWKRNRQRAAGGLRHSAGTAAARLLRSRIGGQRERSGDGPSCFRSDAGSAGDFGITRGHTTDMQAAQGTQTPAHTHAHRRIEASVIK